MPLARRPNDVHFSSGKAFWKTLFLNTQHAYAEVQGTVPRKSFLKT